LIDTIKSVEQNYKWIIYRLCFENYQNKYEIINTETADQIILDSDGMDQQWQPVACQWHEKHVSMTIFALILDLAFSTGYAIGCTLSTQYKCSVQFDKFKLCTAEQLTRPWQEARSEKASIRKCKQEVQQSPSVPPASLQTHVL
jgi:hypothetical protein